MYSVSTELRELITGKDDGFGAALSQTSELIHEGRQIKIECGQASGIVGCEVNVHLIIHIAPVGMMAHFFRSHGRRRHKAKGFGKIFENKFPRYFLAISLPARKVAQPILNFGFRKFHGSIITLCFYDYWWSIVSVVQTAIRAEAGVGASYALVI